MSLFFLSVVSIVGMFIDVLLFRWLFMPVVVAESVSILIAPELTQKKKIAAFEYSAQRVVDGMIVALSFKWAPGLIEVM